MAEYFVDFENLTSQTWTMGIYQEFPQNPGLKSVSWKQTTVPKSGSSGVKWSVDYWVILGDYRQTGGKGVYKSSQKFPTDLGKQWKIVYKEQCQQLVEDGTTAPGELKIVNESHEYANPGIGMDGAASAFKSDVVSGSAAQFIVTPTYWVGLFRNVEIGEVISSDIVVCPVKIKFEGEKNKKLVVAEEIGGDLRLTITDASQTYISMAQVQQMLALKDARDNAHPLELSYRR